MWVHKQYRSIYTIQCFTTYLIPDGIINEIILIYFMVAPKSKYKGRTGDLALYVLVPFLPTESDTVELQVRLVTENYRSVW